MRASISLAAIARLARVTTTSVEAAGVEPDDARAAAPPRARAPAGTLPVWPRSGARKIAHVGDGAGVLDEVADAHDVAGDDDRRLAAPGAARPGAAVCAAPRPASERGEQAVRERAWTVRIMAGLLSASWLAVACSIWSAAVMTLAFIS